MKTSICYTRIEDLSEELKLLLIQESFNREDLRKIQFGLLDSDADYDGENGDLIKEIGKIIKTDNDVISYHNNL